MNPVCQILIYCAICLNSYTGISQTTVDEDSLFAHSVLEKANDFYFKNRDYDSASFYYKQAIPLFRKIMDIDNVSLSQLRAGNCAYKNRDYNTALSFFQANLITLQHEPPDSPKIGTVYNNIGTVYSVMGKHYESKSNIEKGLKIRLQSLPEKDPQIRRQMGCQAQPIISLAQKC